MRSFQIGTLVLATTAFVPAQEAATIRVPQQFPQIQGAVYAAAPNDVIVVASGTYNPFKLDKPLTILGEPGVIIDNTAYEADVRLGTSGTPDPNVELLGPGSGRVVLSNLELRGDNDFGLLFSNLPPRVQGGGFDELHIIDCVVDRPYGTFPPIETYKPVETIEVSTPFVLMQRSESTGMSGGQLECFDLSTAGNMPQSAAGLYAPESTVVLLDSKVVGGPAMPLTLCGDLCLLQYRDFPFGPFESEFHDLTVDMRGGDGVVARELLHANSEMVGGAGNPIYCYEGLRIFSGYSVIGHTLPGQPYVAERAVELDSSLRARRNPIANGTWSLTSVTSGDPTLLIAGPPRRPQYAAGRGWLFIDPVLVAPVPGGIQTLHLEVPGQIGLELGVQLLDPSNGLTRPVLGVIEPDFP